MYYVWQQADVLVNPVASKEPDLTKAGAVSSHFSQVAGSELQQARALVYIMWLKINYVNGCYLVFI